MENTLIMKLIFLDIWRIYVLNKWILKIISNLMKILITGTAGFIGFHLAETFVKRSFCVGIDQMNDYYDINLKYDRLKYSGIDVDKELEVG